MNEVCSCHRMATRRCSCGTPMCENCYKIYYACKLAEWEQAQKDAHHE